MNTKTWKLGENAKGGVITLEIWGNAIVIIGKDWDYSQGSNKGSNQSNAKAFTTFRIARDNPEAYRKTIDFLEDLTTSYYAEEIMKWIKTKMKFKTVSWW